MAHELMLGKGLTVGQALHGYADGHRQIALSNTLTARDQRTLLALSDVSGAGARLDDDGYLTGYPLTESGVFALARTWPAPEMPRPGCVWTHTLLIEFADLATLPSLVDLALAFRRPMVGDGVAQYRMTTTVPVRLEFSPLDGKLSSWAKQVLVGLYGRPIDRIISTRAVQSARNIEQAVLAIWSQQWPRLRRSFKFCTLSASDRSIEGAAFDIQVVAGADRTSRSRFADAVDAERLDVKEQDAVWLDDALQDLCNPDGNGLRTLFRRLGPDVGGREAFSPLCRLHTYIQSFDRDPAAFRGAVRLLESEIGADRKQGRTAQLLVARAALGNIDRLDPIAFDFLWTRLDSIEPEALISAATRLGLYAWRLDPTRLVDMSLKKELADVIVERAIQAVEELELVEGLRKAPSLSLTALRLRPGLVAFAELWQDSDWASEAFIVANESGRQEDAARAILVAGRLDLANETVAAFGAATLLRAIASNVAASIDVTAWIRATLSDIDGVVAFLKGPGAVPPELLIAMLNIIPPNMLPGSHEGDPWLAALSRTSMQLSPVQEAHVAAYLLRRALRTGPRNAVELVRAGFEPTYRATAAYVLPHEDWRHLDELLPTIGFWSSGDRLLRMRAGLADLFIGKDLSPESFGRLVSNGSLFVSLMQTTSTRSRGSTYLKRVQKALQKIDDPVMQARAKIIKELK